MPLVPASIENAVLGLAVFAAVCGGVGLLMMRRLPSQRQILDKWAQDRGMKIIEAHRRIWFCGPFTLLRSTSQAVFRITALTPAGRSRKGYARVGGFTGLGDYAKVAWDRDVDDSATDADAGLKMP